MTTRSLQAWLNTHGAGLAEDGKFGPATRNAVIEVFRNQNAPVATLAEIEALAAQLGCTKRQFMAVASVESGGSGWDKSGLLKCLWERHWLWRRVKIAVPFLSDPKPGGYTVDADHDGICDSWEKLADASGRFGFDVAAECASFGKFQIMGGHWKALGYPSVREFIWQLSRAEAAHLDAFARYIKVNNLQPALRRVSSNPDHCRAIARGYNGSAYERGSYHVKIARAWEHGR